MQASEWPALSCLEHLLTLVPDGSSLKDSSVLSCEKGCQVPVVRGIPRFVASDNYAAAFGIQWNAFKKTQLDSENGTTIFRDRLTGSLGGSLEVVRNKKVLEVGCGAGPFTEILLSAGALVLACDLSNAVEANYENCGASPNHFVCQADLMHLPFPAAEFDVVLCLGVVQHTPDPQATIAALARQVKPGGMLVIDHYGPAYPYPLSRRILRPLLLRLPPAIATRMALGLARALLPIHKLAWNNRRGVWRIRNFLRKHSPLVDHYDDFPQLKPSQLAEWCVLNTHDTLTDRYKHLRNPEEIREHLTQSGLSEITSYYGGNGVEARARKPLATPVKA